MYGESGSQDGLVPRPRFLYHAMKMYCTVRVHLHYMYVTCAYTCTQALTYPHAHCWCDITCSTRNFLTRRRSRLAKACLLFSHTRRLLLLVEKIMGTASGRSIAWNLIPNWRYFSFGFLSKQDGSKCAEQMTECLVGPDHSAYSRNFSLCI